MKKTLRLLSLLLTALLLFPAFASLTGAEESLPFADVAKDAYYGNAVAWAFDEGITTGKTADRFAPDDTCTRGQVATFLWRACGEPVPETAENPFEDVRETDYYYEAILWAVEKGITNGTSAKRFSPDVTCTNAHIITFVWRTMGQPESTGKGEWYSDAVNWAMKAGLLDGTYEGEFIPSGDCPRANVVTYLYAYKDSENFPKTLKITVSEDSIFSTVEAARDYIRTVDRNAYSQIAVIIEPGAYHIDAPIRFTEEDGGNENCHIIYKGLDGASIEGAITLRSSDFKPATGSAVQYFKEEAKDNIVQIDLKQYGYSATMMTDLYDDFHTLNLVAEIPMLYSDGARLSVARYPNEGWAKTMEGSQIPGGENAAVDYVTDMYIYFGEEYADTVRSWHDITKVFVDARFSYTWVNENTRIRSVESDRPMMTLAFSGGHDPHLSTPFFWYNIPEELDFPGEYYIDEDSILYLYKYDGFEDAVITIPKTDYAIDVSGADYLTFDNLLIESFFKQAFTVNADHFTLRNSTVRGIVSKAAYVSGYDNLIERNEIYNIGDHALEIGGGDPVTMKESNSVVRNNSIHDWGQVKEQYSYGLSFSGVGILATHNELYNCPHIAVFFGGHLCTVEYSYVHDVLLHADDVGAFASSGYYDAFGNTVRYCYIENVGPSDPAFMVADYDTWYPACGSNVFYWDFHGSGQETYGNVINHVYGDAYHSSGYFNTVTNSLIVGCAKYALEVFDTNYREHFEQGVDLIWYYNSIPDSFTEGLLKRFPRLAELRFGNSDVVEGDLDYAGCPQGIVMKNNAVYVDKAYMWKDTMAKGKSPFQYEKYITLYNDVAEEDYTRFSSLRNPVDIGELVKENEEILGMTYEQFISCGIQK